MATRQGKWTLPTWGSIDSLQYSSDTEAATDDDLGPFNVLVEMRAASLNYRDIAIMQGQLPLTIPRKDVVPGSDGAGVVKAVGNSVTFFKPGDPVVTHLAADPDFGDDELPLTPQISAGLGQHVDGTLRESGIFHQAALVPMPSNMTFEEAATLTCSGLTAWNALMGLKDRRVKAGDWVLVQGTGGVSVAALQIALAAGASVIATTSTEAKAERLRSLGVTHVVNYRECKDWGAVAKTMTSRQRGFDHVVDVGGNATLPQSMEAARVDGVVSLVGMVAGQQQPGDVAMMGALWHSCVIRGFLLGSRNMFRDFVRFCEAKDLKPALDDVAFPLVDAKMAYSRLAQQKHFSKVVIKIS